MKWCSNWGTWPYRNPFLAASADLMETEKNQTGRERRNFMVGVLVHGNNHLIVRGPLPNRDTARALVRQWSIIQIEAVTPAALEQWSISTREFREDLAWAVVVPGDGDITPAVSHLLDELSLRGIAIHNSAVDSW